MPPGDNVTPSLKPLTVPSKVPVMVYEPDAAVYVYAPLFGSVGTCPIYGEAQPVAAQPLEFKQA